MKICRMQSIVLSLFCLYRLAQPESTFHHMKYPCQESPNEDILVSKPADGNKSYGTLMLHRKPFSVPGECNVTIIPVDATNGIILTVAEVDFPPGCEDNLRITFSNGNELTFCENLNSSSKSGGPFAYKGDVTLTYYSKKGVGWDYMGFEIAFTSFEISDCNSSFLFRCDNGYCINEALICDGYINCNNGSDEDNCDAYELDYQEKDSITKKNHESKEHSPDGGYGKVLPAGEFDENGRKESRGGSRYDRKQSKQGNKKGKAGEKNSHEVEHNDTYQKDKDEHHDNEKDEDHYRNNDNRNQGKHDDDNHASKHDDENYADKHDDNTQVDKYIREPTDGKHNGINSKEFYDINDGNGLQSDGEKAEPLYGGRSNTEHVICLDMNMQEWGIPLGGILGIMAVTGAIFVTILMIGCISVCLLLLTIRKKKPSTTSEMPLLPESQSKV